MIERGLFVIFTLIYFLDIAITVPNWSLESNPLVLQLGVFGFAVIKILAFISLFLIWYKLEAKESKISQSLLGLLAGYYFIVVTQNLYVLIK